MKHPLGDLKEDSDPVYLRLDCKSCDFVTRNDLRVRFLQIGLVPERLIIDESKEKVVAMFSDPRSADRFRESLRHNPTLFDFIADFVELGPAQAQEFDEEFRAKQKRNAAIRSLKRTHGIQKERGGRLFHK